MYASVFPNGESPWMRNERNKKGNKFNLICFCYHIYCIIYEKVEEKAIYFFFYFFCCFWPNDMRSNMLTSSKRNETNYAWKQQDDGEDKSHQSEFTADKLNVNEDKRNALAWSTIRKETRREPSEWEKGLSSSSKYQTNKQRIENEKEKTEAKWSKENDLWSMK